MLQVLGLRGCAHFGDGQPECVGDTFSRLYLVFAIVSAHMWLESISREHVAEPQQKKLKKASFIVATQQQHDDVVARDSLLNQIKKPISQRKQGGWRKHAKRQETCCAKNACCAKRHAPPPAKSSRKKAVSPSPRRGHIRKQRSKRVQEQAAIAEKDDRTYHESWLVREDILGTLYRAYFRPVLVPLSTLEYPFV